MNSMSMELNLYYYKMNTLLLLALSLSCISSQQLLNNVYITFSLAGNVNYMPTSGGLPTPGYKMIIGFDYYAWLGVTFSQQTSTHNYDILIFQRSATQSGGVYTCSVKDYYASSGRPDNLMMDSQTSLDQVVTTTSNNSYFSMTLPRTKGNTNGQDWQGGQFANICFFTNDLPFSESTWSKQYQICYGYQIINYVSTYRGRNLGSMYFQGVSSQIYGGIQGSNLQLKLFWYRNNPTMTNTSQIIIRIGSYISELVGFDFFQCGVGDYFGDIATLQRDLDYSGYQNGGCLTTVTANSVMMSYTRDVYTYDDFDYQVTQEMDVCLIGSQTHCQTIVIPLNYPMMSVASALNIFEVNLTWILSLLFFLMML